ncbi:MAG: D-glycero-beta-D-manno-heptose-7-phosphate kinase [Thermodesulfovibrionia bacterium]
MAEGIFKRFEETGILVIGDLMVDHYIWGKVKRISPEAPVPVVEVSGENLLPGGAANVANNLISLGARVFVTGVIGDDEMGKRLVKELNDKGINTDGIIIDSDRPTTVKTRIIAHNQQVVRFDREAKKEVNSSVQSTILSHVKDCLPYIKGIIISDYCKGVITKRFMNKLLNMVDLKRFIAVDPKIGHFDYYRGVSLLTPNTNEASVGAGIEIVDEKTLIMAGKRLMERLQCKTVLITRGEEGMTLFEDNGEVTHIPTSAREVYDVTGAGDTVIATFTLSHCAGAPLRESAVYANYAAGIVVGEVGTTVISKDKLISSIRKGKA